MLKSRGRASRSESGTWRRESAEADNGEHAISQEETTVRPGATVVAKPARGRRSKAEPAPASTAVADGFDDKLRERTQRVAAREAVKPKLRTNQKRGDTSWSTLSITTAVIAFLCLLGLIISGVSPARVPDQASRPRGLSEGDTSSRIDGFFDWFNVQWTKGRLGAVEEKVQTVNSIQPNADEEPSWKSSGFASPHSPACGDSIVHATEEEGGTKKIKDPFPPALVLVTTTFPAVSNFMRRLIEFCHHFVDDYPWLSLLWTICGGWKAAELLIALMGTVGVYMLWGAERAAERMAKKDTDDDSERARREAVQKLLLRMSVIEKEKEKETEKETEVFESKPGSAPE